LRSEQPAGAAYPPAPWRLAGHACLSVFVLPAAQLPAVPEGFTPLVLAGRGLMVAGWVSYEEGSVLEYSELFAAVAGRFGGRPTATVTHMWVDSEPSMAGGRELWGYPKELAEFDLDLDPDGSAVARADGVELARGEFRASTRLPRMPRTRTGTVQPVDGRLTPIPAVGSGRPVLGRGWFAPGPEGPLAFLTTGRRLATFGLQDFRAEFG
jgi:Acetoacetate decarboxylase (ADC)